MIKIENLSKTFRNGNTDFYALKDVSFSFKDAGLYFIIGKSGSGKSTLLDIIGGLQKPTSGGVEAPAGTRFSYVFQDENLVFGLSLLDNLRLVEEDGGKIDGALGSVGLAEKKATKVSLLSKGERARLAIARAVLAQGDAILLDEPTGNLDSANAKTVYDLLKKVSAAKLVVVVTHDAEAAKAYGDCVLTLSDGALVAVEERGTEPSVPPSPSKEIAKPTGIPADLAARYALRKAFAKKTKLILSSLNLALTAMLLFVGCDSAFFDGVSYIRQAIREGDVATYRVGKYKDGEGFSGSTGMIDNGKSLYSKASSYGVTPSVGLGFYTSPLGDNLYFNFVDDPSPVIGGVSYSVPEGGILVSDCVSEKLSLPVGGSVVYGTLSLIVSGVYQTGASLVEGDAAAVALARNDDAYCYVNSEDFVAAESEQGISGPDFLFGSLPAGRTYAPGLSTASYISGRAPEAAAEIAVSSAYASEVWPQEDGSEILGRVFPTSETDGDTYGIASHLASLTVVGIYDSAGSYSPYDFLTSGAFFEALGDDFRLAATNSFFFVDKAGACTLASAEADASSGLGLTTKANENPAATAHSASLGFRDMAKVALIASLVFLALALSSLTLYSFDNVKANEKDVAMLRLLGKRPSDIMRIFAFMNLAPSLIALVAAYAGGPLLATWIGATFAHAIGTTIAPPPLSVAAFFLVLVPLLVIPFLVSLLSLLRIQKCEPSLVFKRNLQ